MKTNLLATIMGWALAASLILSAIYLYQYFSRTGDIRTMQPEVQVDMAKVQNAVMLSNRLLSEAVAYSERKPAIKPVLDAILARAQGGTNAPRTATPQ